MTLERSDVMDAQMGTRDLTEVPIAELEQAMIDAVLDKAKRDPEWRDRIIRELEMLNR